MIKKIESFEDISTVINQNPREYSLGALVREVVDLNSPGLLVELLERSKEERDAVCKTIEGRLETLYAELDRREKDYKTNAEKFYKISPENIFGKL